MSDRPNTPTDHPEELLAGYVDGSASPQERGAVEAHLASCRQCREEAGLARIAHARLVSLPELDAPGLAERGLAGLRGPGLKPVPGGAEGERPEAHEDEGGRGPVRRRPVWVPALAAAAIVAIAGAIALPIRLRGGGAPTRPSTQAAGTPAPSPLPPLVDVGARYTPAAVSALAKRLAPAARSAEAAPASPGASAPVFGSQTSAAPGKGTLSAADQATSRTALDCLIGGGGLEANALPLYLERATFKGVPAYIGAFARPGSRLNLVVVAVSEGTCQPLYTLTQPA